MDAESENDIMQAIHSLAGKKTIILISHRLANVVHSDCIYAMSNGRVIEQGTHAELLAKQGLTAACIWHSGSWKHWKRRMPDMNKINRRSPLPLWDG